MIGGKRAGAGRKRVMEGELLTTVAFGLAKQHVEAIKQWQHEHSSTSASEAVRQMIDHAYGDMINRPVSYDEPPEILSAVLPAGDENSPDWQWKRQPISRPTKESRPKRTKPNSKSKGD